MRAVYELVGINPDEAQQSLMEAITDEHRRERMREGTDIFRVLIKTLLKAGIITDRTKAFYAMYVDMEELKNEGDQMVGDAIAEEGIKYLQTVNFGTPHKGSALLAAE
jgi:aspartate/methionine/tyrosine aminotransferase